MRLTKNIALGVSAAVLSAGMLGGSVLASQSALPATAQTSLAQPASALVDKDKDKAHARADRLEDVLNKLVEKGVITKDQEQAILEAVRRAHANGDRDRGEHRFTRDFMKVTANYLGISVEDLAAQMKAGKSPAEIARGLGKTREGLVDALDADVAAKIKAAVDAGKIKPEQAEALRTKLDEAVIRFVDHERSN